MNTATYEYINGHVQEITNAGFTTELWSPFGGIWSPSEEEASKEIFTEQLLCAMMTFYWLFVSPVKKVWIHIAAEMQAGKTGAVAALVRIVYSNIEKLRIPPHKVFMLTGMSDNAWLKQTKERLPELFRKNVFHNAHLPRVMKQLKMLHEHDDLSNILIVIDESQIASGGGNRMSKNIYSYLKELCPVSEWRERGIRFVTISATDPAKVMAMEGGELAKTVRLLTTDAYQSVEKLNTSGRIRYIEDVGEIHTESGMKSLVADVNSFPEPRYHLIRPRPGKVSIVNEMLRSKFQGCQIIQWDSERNKNKSDDTSSSSSVDMEDINTLLRQKPIVTTFILLKNMFYAAKTMDDTNVGVAFDRISVKDETNLQGLLGRLCGYKKRIDTIVYTSKATVYRWIQCWKERCSEDEALLKLPNFTASELTNKMTNVVAANDTEGNAMLTVKKSAACPLGVGVGSDPVVLEAMHVEVNESDFTDEWREFPSFEDAKKWGKNIHVKKKDANGFELSSTTGKARKLLTRDLLPLKGGKKTSAMPTNHKKKGEVRDRLFVIYSNENDPLTGTWVIHRLTRVTDV